MLRVTAKGITLLATLNLLTAASTHAKTGPIVVKDLDGRPHTFFSSANADTKPSVFVFVFVLPDCPVCNSYAPELRRLRSAFAQLEFYLVYADPDVSTAQARQHSKDYGFGFPGLLDPEHRLVRQFGATRVPEAAVVASDGKLLYRGRIDDRYVDFGKKRDRAQHRDLQDALDSILKNKPARWPDKPPIGCYIPGK